MNEEFYINEFGKPERIGWRDYVAIVLIAIPVLVAVVVFKIIEFIFGKLKNN